jgi:hypothetical protein
MEDFIGYTKLTFKTMRIHETKHQVNILPEKWEDFSVDLDGVVAARRYEESYTQILLGIGVAYIIQDSYESFSGIWGYNAKFKLD